LHLICKPIRHCPSHGLANLLHAQRTFRVGLHRCLVLPAVSVGEYLSSAPEHMILVQSSPFVMDGSLSARNAAATPCPARVGSACPPPECNESPGAPARSAPTLGAYTFQGSLERLCSLVAGLPPGSTVDLGGLTVRSVVRTPAMVQAGRTPKLFSRSCHAVLAAHASDDTMS
jgi:hypothetical protein